MERRDFLKTAVIGAIPIVADASVDTPASLLLAAGERDNETSETDRPSAGEMPRRPLGRTGEKVSILGLGGFHIGKVANEQESVGIMRLAIDRGITFMDNSWDYNGGESERRMGKALRNGYRQKVFLMTKVDGRTRESAAQQIDDSLRRLQTDRVDLMQFHEVIRMEDPDRIFADGGAIEAFLAAKKAGKLRFIGFTGHKDPAVHLRMLDVARDHGFRFDAVQMPLNVMDAHFRSFGKQVLPRLLKDEIGVLGMKSMGSGVILQSKVVSPVECLRYAMSLRTSTVITGIDSVNVLTQDLELAQNFTPFNSEEMASLLRRTALAAARGRYELFKTDRQFDSTAANPRWLG